MVINGIKKLKNSTMFSNAKVLVAGTMLAQAISILSAPFLAIIYSPEEFGVYAVFLSASSVFISVSMMRYELAIVLPKHKSVGRALAVFALCSCVVVSLLLFIVTILWGKHLQNIFGEVSETWLYWVPAIVLFSGAFQVYYHWNIRRSNMFSIAGAKVATNATMVTSQVSLGLQGLGIKGLVFGAVIGKLIGAFLLMFRGKLILPGPRTTVSEMKQSAFEYRRFCYLQLPSTLVNVAYSHLRFFVFAMIFLPNTVGQLFLTFKVLLLPATMIGTSLSDVIYQRFSELKNSGVNNKELTGKLKKIIILEIIVFAPFCFVLFVFAPEIFNYIFGEEWWHAGVYASILAPAILIQLVSSPLTKLLLVYNRNELFLRWEVMRLIVMYSPILILDYLDSSETSIIIGISASTALAYLILLCVLRRVSHSD